MNSSDLLAKEAFAALVGVSLATLNRHLSMRHLATVRAGRRLLIPRSEAERWLALRAANLPLCVGGMEAVGGVVAV